MGDRRDDSNSVDVGTFEDVERICCDRDGRIASANAVQRLGIKVAHRSDDSVCSVMEIADDVRSPISIANNTNSYCSRVSTIVIHRTSTPASCGPTNYTNNVKERLIGALATYDSERRLEKDLDVVPERTFPNVSKVHPDHFVKSRPAAAVDLPHSG